MTEQQTMALIAAGTGIVGAILGASVSGVLTHWNNSAESRKQRMQDQLDSFYGPMLALRQKTKAIKEFQLEVSRIAGDEWPKLFSGPDGQRINNPDVLKSISDERSPAFEAAIEYDNQKFVEELLPSYREMLGLFLGKLHLAETSTANYLVELIRFIEIDERWVKKVLPREVLPRLNQSEKRLEPFYDDLEANFKRLQRKISQ